MQDEGQDQLSGAELVADVLHRGQEHLIEHVHRALAGQGLVDQGFDAFLLAVEDLVMDLLFGGHAGGGILGRSPALGLGLMGLEVVDEPGESVLPAVEDHVLGELALLGGDLGDGRDMAGVDDGQVQAGLHAVVEEDRVQDGPGMGSQAERDVADAQDGQDAGKLALDRADALDRGLG
ncbi:hypothetical protein D3C86_1493660 [compost metagenome]